MIGIIIFVVLLLISVGIAFLLVKRKIRKFQDKKEAECREKIKPEEMKKIISEDKLFWEEKIKKDNERKERSRNRLKGNNKQSGEVESRTTGGESSSETPISNEQRESVQDAPIEPVEPNSEADQLHSVSPI